MGIWVHPYTVRPVQVGSGFGGFGVDLNLSPSNVVMSLLRLQQALDWIPHPYIGCKQSVLSLRYGVNGHMGPPGGGWILGYWGQI